MMFVSSYYLIVSLSIFEENLLLQTIVNSAIYAMQMLQNEMTGETERVGSTSDDDVMALGRELRNEDVSISFASAAPSFLRAAYPASPVPSNGRYRVMFFSPAPYAEQRIFFLHISSLFCHIVYIIIFY